MRDDNGNRPVRPVRTYASLDNAYKHFNRHLFGGLLAPCIITLQRHKGAFGYFVAARMAELDDGEDQAVDEIALNPASFAGRLPRDILSTLVHEMAHLWQHHYGTPGRDRYHNAEWAAKMKAIGLIPSHTSRPGGRETGQKMSHYIEEGGAYARAYARLECPRILYKDVHDAGESAARKKKTASKTKYTCPGCAANAWAKPG
jgi:SprT-like family